VFIDSFVREIENRNETRRQHSSCRRSLLTFLFARIKS